jgi:uncharacterized protein YukE
MDEITYNPGVIAGFKSDVMSTAAQLIEVHDEARQVMAQLDPFFAGQGATQYFESQSLLLQGFTEQAEAVQRHGAAVGQVLDSAIATDQSTASFF